MFRETNLLWVSRTTDRGASWSPPVLVDQPPPFAIDFAPKVLVLPDGTLLAVFARADFQLGLGQLYAARSPDEGRTWLPPVLAGSKPLPSSLIDPGSGAELPQPGFPSAAVAPTAASTSPSRTTARRARARSGWPARATAVAPGPASPCRG